MFCLFELVKTKQKVVAGNVHLHYNPAKDFIKFAQAAYILEKASQFVGKHTSGRNDLPLFICGDFNSMPVSSVMSLIHNENIDEPRDDQVSTWKYPEDIGDWKREYY